tara:strand:+ start:770 stop:1003 length:234 start_codon:yes stop_codon:yes gene_type:complete
MLAKNMSNILPVIGMILVLIIVSMMVVNYFGVNMNVTDGIRNLNRSAVFEGMKHGKDKKNGKKEEEKELFEVSSLME